MNHLIYLISGFSEWGNIVSFFYFLYVVSFNHLLVLLIYITFPLCLSNSFFFSIQVLLGIEMHEMQKMRFKMQDSVNSKDLMYNWISESTSVSVYLSFWSKYYHLHVLDLFIYFLLRSCSSSDHEATAMMKAQLMSLWDGLNTDFNC